MRRLWPLTIIETIRNPLVATALRVARIGPAWRLAQIAQAIMPRNPPEDEYMPSAATRTVHLGSPWAAVAISAIPQTHSKIASVLLEPCGRHPAQHIPTASNAIPAAPSINSWAIYESGLRR